MLRCLLAASILAATGGCFSSGTNVEKLATPAAPTATNVSPASSDAGSPRVEITPAAREKLEEFRKIDPSQRVILISVEFEDEAARSGPSYHLRLGADPDPEEYHLTDNAGLPVAIEKSHLSFLNGLRLDWLTVSDETAGFYFDNPNDKSNHSQPEASEEATPPQPRSGGR